MHNTDRIESNAEIESNAAVAQKCQQEAGRMRVQRRMHRWLMLRGSHRDPFRSERSENP